MFFLDECFEELAFDVSTTVLEAVEQLAGIIKLQNYNTFTLFECRKAIGPKATQVSLEEHEHEYHLKAVSIPHLSITESIGARRGTATRMSLSNSGDRKPFVEVVRKDKLELSVELENDLWAMQRNQLAG